MKDISQSGEGIKTASVLNQSHLFSDKQNKWWWKPHIIFATFFNQKRWMLTQYHSGSLRTLWENEQTRFHLSCFNNDTIHRQMKRKQSEASCVTYKLYTRRRRLLFSLDFVSGDPQGAHVTDAASLFSASLLRSSQQNEVRHGKPQDALILQNNW